MRITITFMFVMLFIVNDSCRNKATSRGSRTAETASLIKEHDDAYKIYYAANAVDAEKALEKYVSYIDASVPDIETTDMQAWRYSDKALAIGRIAFIKSYIEAEPLKFQDAKAAFLLARNYFIQVNKLHSETASEMRLDVLSAIKYEDLTRVPWVTDLMIKQAESELK